jgi:hypothetical protein
LRKSRDEYNSLLSLSLQQMHEVLKSGRWLSVVFAHRDTAYWEALVESCRAAGFEYVNTVTQPVGVVWSVHKKKNPLRVLSGELVLNFRKQARAVRAVPEPLAADPDRVVRECCEREIVRNCGATTEDLHHAVVPRLLETRLLKEFSRTRGDLTPLLEEAFEFDRASGRWHLKEGADLVGKLPKRDLVRYHVLRFLERREREGRPATEADVEERIHAVLLNGRSVPANTVRSILDEVAYSSDSHLWRRIKPSGQMELPFGQAEG